MKKIYRAMAGIILALLLAIGLASLFTTGVGSDGADTSKPQFSMQALLDGTFISSWKPGIRTPSPCEIRFEGEPLAQRLLPFLRRRRQHSPSSTAAPMPSRAAESLARQEYEKTGQTLENERSLRRKRPAMLRLPIRKPEQNGCAGNGDRGDERRSSYGADPEPTEEDSVPELDNPISPRHSTPEMS